MKLIHIPNTSRYFNAELVLYVRAYKKSEVEYLFVTFTDKHKRRYTCNTAIEVAKQLSQHGGCVINFKNLDKHPTIQSMGLGTKTRTA